METVYVLVVCTQTLTQCLAPQGSTPDFTREICLNHVRTIQRQDATKHVQCRGLFETVGIDSEGQYAQRAGF